MNISEKRTNVMFNKLLSYIYEHNTDAANYAYVLKSVGFTKEEVLSELVYSCGFNPDDMENLVNKLYEYNNSFNEEINNETVY